MGQWFCSQLVPAGNFPDCVGVRPDPDLPGTRARWGRILGIVVAVLSLIKFPFGTALGIWTLVVLLGFQNSTLYEQLEQR